MKESSTKLGDPGGVMAEIPSSFGMDTAGRVVAGVADGERVGVVWWERPCCCLGGVAVGVLSDECGRDPDLGVTEVEGVRLSWSESRL